MSVPIRRQVLLHLLLSFFLMTLPFGSCFSTLPEDVFPVSRVRAGMRGYGLTVFKGTQIERFEVEVIGVLEQANLGRPLVLIRMAGGPITERQANIIAGMSGSPIYLNGKILGAVAYGFSFPKEPLGLVTPLEDMLEAFDPKLSSPSSLTQRSRSAGFDGYTRQVSLARPLRVGGRLYKQLCFSLQPPRELKPGVAWVRPLLMPVMVSGISPRNLKKVEELLAPYGLRPLLAPGGVRKTAVQAQFRPGAAIGGSIVIGDIDLTAIGTLTYRRGNRVLAFGHPFLDLGSIEMPMSAAYIVDVMSSYDSSEKLGNRAQLVGAIVQDRAFGIAGEMGRQARLLPMTIRVHDQTTGRHRTLRCEMVNHPLFLRRLVALVASEAVARVHQGVGEVTARVRFQLEAEPLGRIERENLVSDPYTIEEVALRELMQLMGELENNPFEPVRFKRLALEITLRNAHHAATIERLFVRENRYKPGEVVEVGVILKPYKGERITRLMQIRLPKNLPNGRYLLQVRGGSGAPLLPPDLPASLAAQIGAPPARAPVNNLQQLVKRFLERERNQELVLRLQLDKSAVYLEGERLTQLPPVMLDVLRTPTTSGVRLEREELKQVEATEWVLSGAQSILIHVQREDYTEQPSRPTPPAMSPTPPTEVPPTPDQPPDTPDEESLEETLRLGGSPTTATLLTASHLQRHPAAPSPSQPPATPPPADREEEKPERPQAATEKPVSRPVKRWQPLGFETLSKGKMEGTTVTASGKIQLTHRLRLLCRLPHAYIWSLATDPQGRLYAGAGPNGAIYQIRPDGHYEEWVRVPGIAVTALCTDDKGNLYAGCSPEGVLYRIPAKGQSEKVLETGAKYVNALLWAENTLYIATGAPARLLAWQSNSTTGSQPRGTELFTNDETHFTALARDAKGNLYVGTSDRGILYRVGPQGAQAVYDSDEPSITALACDQQGNLYIGTHPRGNLYRLTPEGHLTTLNKHKGGLSMRHLVVLHSQLYGVAGDRVYRTSLRETDSLLPLENWSTLSYKDTLDLLSAAVHGDRLYVGTANAGEILVSERVQQGTYESPVHDAQQVADWGYLRWSAEIPEGTHLILQTRSGNTREPDESWSAWSPPYLKPDGSRILSPAGRYIQFRATLQAANSPQPSPPSSAQANAAATPNPFLTPVLHSVSLSYQPRNRPPRIALKEPAPYAIWSGKKTIRWEASDPDGDTLTYEVFISSDGGKSWQKLESKPAASKPSSEKRSPIDAQVPSTEEMMAKLQEELDKEPGLSPEMRQEILSQAQQSVQQMHDELQQMAAEGKPLPAEITGASGPSTTRPEEPSRQASSLTWDTTKYKDGSYLLKIVATDKPSLATGFYRVEKISEPVLLCNTAPTLLIARTATQVNKERRAEIRGFVFQYFSSSTSDGQQAAPKASEHKARTPHDEVPIIAVQYRLKGGQWYSAEPLDGFFDSGSEEFRILTDPLPPGEQTLEVKAFNAAGKTSTQEVKIK